MVTAPWNNPILVSEKKFLGVGGHLFAIAAERSNYYGYDYELTGFAANSILEKHYVNAFGAIRIHMLHPYQILIPAKTGREIKEVYTYEWTDDEL